MQAQPSEIVKVMDESYNENALDWSNLQIETTMRDLIACVHRYYEMSPSRFEAKNGHFVIAEFGCA
jgi:hypothetical protein